MNNSNVIVSGWLRKSPPEKKLRKNAWRKRWFVLKSGRLSGDPNLLQYYKHEGSKKVLGAISLDECTQIDANVPVKYDRKDHSQQFVFDIVTKTRTYYLVADNSNEMSLWVRRICDLCGFNHDSSDASTDLGTQQQTFRPSQPVSNFTNGTPLLFSEEDSTVEAPIPFPRPKRTFTTQSILIRNTGQNGNPNIHKSTASSNDPSGSGTPAISRAQNVNNNPHRDGTFSQQQNSTVDQADDREYLLLSDFTTVQTTQTLPVRDAKVPTVNPSHGDRRLSTDSVFMHEGASSENGDILVDPTIQSVPISIATITSRKNRLDSMPDCPPPQPPVKDRTKIDERGMILPHDKDLVLTSRMKSHPAGGVLSPIDDTELHRVPLSLQQQYGVDDMGKNIIGSTASYQYTPYNTSSGYATSEYINTTDATSEGRLGSNASYRHDFPQHDSSANHQYSSSSNKSFTSAITNSSVFFNSSAPPFDHRHIVVDSSPRHTMYSPPRYNSPHHFPVSSKGSLYSSTNALPPYPAIRGSPVFTQPAPLVPRLRRSSSVGHLESVANDFASQDRDPSLLTRRSSIDHKRGVFAEKYHFTPLSFNNSLTGRSVHLPGHVTNHVSRSTPPPRPPKSEKAIHESIKLTSLNEQIESRDYLKLSESSADALHSVPPSPPHTEVVAVVLSPDEENRSLSPLHSAIVKTVPLTDSDKEKKLNSVNHNGRTCSSSSSNASNATGISSGCSSAAGVYDVVPAIVQEPRLVSIYDTPRKQNTFGDLKTAIYDFPKTNLYDNPKPAVSIYDSPVRPINLPHIDESRSSYEVMVNQLDSDSLPGDNIQVYTCMAGASSLVESPSFTKKPTSPSRIRLEAPPVNRELKPGRRSLGSDGGISDASKFHHLKNITDESSYDYNDSSSADVPISPPHTVLMHTVGSPVLAKTPSHDSIIIRTNDRKIPPERPPKLQSGHVNFSPRPSLASAGNTYMQERLLSYGFDRSWYNHENPVHSSNKLKPSNPPPGRPPKPINMQPGASPLSRDNKFSSMRQDRDHSKSSPFPRIGYQQEMYSGMYSSVSGAVVPPPQSDPERVMTYVELAEFPTTRINYPSTVDPSSDRAPKNGGKVEYCELDHEKTEALHRSKQVREEQKRGITDGRSIKSGRF